MGLLRQYTGKNNGCYVLARAVIESFLEDIQNGENLDEILWALESPRNQKWLGVICALAKMDKNTVVAELYARIMDAFDKRKQTVYN